MWARKNGSQRYGSRVPRRFGALGPVSGRVGAGSGGGRCDAGVGGGFFETDRAQDFLLGGGGSGASLDSPGCAGERAEVHLVELVGDVGPRVVGAGLDDPDVEQGCLLYTSPSPRARTRSRMPSSA